MNWKKINWIRRVNTEENEQAVYTHTRCANGQLYVWLVLYRLFFAYHFREFIHIQRIILLKFVVMFALRACVRACLYGFYVRVKLLYNNTHGIYVYIYEYVISNDGEWCERACGVNEQANVCTDMYE